MSFYWDNMANDITDSEDESYTNEVSSDSTFNSSAQPPLDQQDVSPAPDFTPINKTPTDVIAIIKKKYSLDNSNPRSKSDFDKFRLELVKKLTTLVNSKPYVEFLIELISELMKPLNHDSKRKIGSEIQKQVNKQIQEASAKPTGKSKQKPQLNARPNKTKFDYDDYDDYD